MGPALGGFLSQPATKYPKVFGHIQLLKDFPYVLPCFFGAFVCLVSFFWAYFHLQETLDKTITEVELQELIEKSEEGEEKSEESIEGGKKDFKSTFDSKKETNFFLLLWFLLRQKDILVTTAIYGFISLSDIIINEIFPLWALTDPKHGGFSFTSNDIGLILSICGPGQLLAQLFLYPKMTDYFGFKKVFLICNTTWTVIVFICPLLAFTNAGPVMVQWLSLISLWGLGRISALFSFTCIFVLINNSSYAHEKATVNGIGQSMASIGRTIGPSIGANIFAWSINNGLGWPLDFHFIFYILTFIGSFTSVLTLTLPSTIDKKKVAPSENQKKVEL